MMERFENTNIKKEKEILPEEYLNKVVNNFVENIKIENSHLEDISIVQFAPCGFFEGENINIIIENFLNSKLPKDKRMLVLFVNGKNTEIDTVSSVILKFKLENVDENIVLLKHVWEKNAPISMGLIRSIPVEFIKQLYSKRGIKSNPVIVSNDADSVRFSKDYLSNLVKDLGQNEFGGSVSRFEFCGYNFLYDLNIVLGQIDRSIRIFDQEQEEFSFKRGTMSPGGSNTAFRLDNYPNYNLLKNRGEDTDLYNKLLDNGAKFKYLNNSKVYTSPRRVINAFNKQKFFYETWKDWKNTGDEGREENSIEKRDFSESEVVDYLNKYFVKRLSYLYEKNYHTGDDTLFCKYANNYIEKILKYLKIFLISAGINIPDYNVCDIEYNNTGDTDGLMKILTEHEFIKVTK